MWQLYGALASRKGLKPSTMMSKTKIGYDTAGNAREVVLRRPMGAAMFDNYGCLLEHC